MALIKKKKIPPAEVPSAGMADIAFLLLLFFLVATTIDVDTGLGLVLPEFVEDPETVEINPDRMAALLINANGEVLLDKEVIAIPQIADIIMPRIRERVNMPSNKKLVVSLKTDRETQYNRYIQALDQVKVAYFTVQDEVAQEQFGKPLDELTEEQAAVIKKEKVPMSISIAEPELIN